MNLNPRFGTTRRSLLRLAAQGVSVPLLGSLLPAPARAAVAKRGKPVRLIFLSLGHGHYEDHFYPSAAGRFSEIEIPPGLEPLRNHFDDITMVSNLSNVKNRQPHGGSESLLTCADVTGFPGFAKHNSISCDQVAARAIGQNTRYESFQLDSPGGVEEGHDGIAMSFREDGSPMPGHVHPRDVFHQFFDSGMSAEAKLDHIRKRRSILDILHEDVSGLAKGSTAEDRDKLDEYFTGIRDVEKRLAREESWIGVPKPKATLPEPSPSMEGEASVRAMLTMMRLAFQADATRVVTYRLPDTSVLTGIGVSHTPHTLSHYGSSSELRDLNLVRTKKWTGILGDFLTELRSAKDLCDPEGGTLYDNTILFFGSGLRAGHRTHSIPCIIAGGGIPHLKHGRHHILSEENTPAANLWLTMLRAVGCEIEQFADSDGDLSEIFA